jgi:hypothetical protein
LGNTGLSGAQALPTVQDVINLLAGSYDLAGYTTTIHILDGSADPGFRVSGPMVGQRGIFGLLVRCSVLGAAVIRPVGGGACVAMDSGAMLSIAECQMDGGTQGLAGTPQDVVQLGQASHIALYGSNRVVQYSQNYNGFTLVGDSSLDIQPQSWGSQIQNGGHLYWQGIFQDGIQTDQGANVEANCNGGHGLIEFKTEAYGGVRAKPYWGVCFADVAAGVMLLSGVDFNGVGADGYRYRIRKGGTLDLNLAQDSGQVNALPGSAGAYPGFSGQGYLI